MSDGQIFQSLLNLPSYVAAFQRVKSVFRKYFSFTLSVTRYSNFWYTKICHKSKPSIKVGSSRYVHTLINEQSLCNVSKLVFSPHDVLLKVRMRLSSTACCMSCPFQKLFYCAQCTAVDYLELFSAQQAKTT
jgi:hypothetical protein